MRSVAQRLLGALKQHQRLSNSTGAIAGFVGAISLLFGLVASRFSPHGWHRAAVVLHIEHKPLLMRLVPVIAGIALALAIAAALLRFGSWYLEREPNGNEDAGNTGAGG